MLLEVVGGFVCGHRLTNAVSVALATAEIKPFVTCGTNRKVGVWKFVLRQETPNEVVFFVFNLCVCVAIRKFQLRRIIILLHWDFFVWGSRAIAIKMYSGRKLVKKLWLIHRLIRGRVLKHPWETARPRKAVRANAKPWLRLVKE